MNTSLPAITPLIVTPAEALPIRPFGLDMQILLPTERTGGAISVLMVCHKPGEGPPDHFHSTQDECIFIVEGTYDVTMDGADRIAGPGSMLFIPRGITHRFKNVGTTLGRMLDWSLPGGQDHYFKAISDLAVDAGFDAATALEISEQHGTHFPVAR
jgi:mannose-6-phosphate isomerase-like protein (cupin superfamily)